MKRLKAAAFFACLAPLGLLVWDGYTDNLGANPIEAITRASGKWTLIFILITLAVTPLRKITGWRDLIKLRRMLGLYAFFYGCLHFLTYVWLDQFFDWGAIAKDVIKRPFITAGFVSFVLLIPLAATSTAAMIRRLGKRWRQLHRLIYVSALGGVLHFLWLVKADIRRPALYGSILAVLLAVRLVPGSALAAVGKVAGKPKSA
ncbi:MAG TPA: protein-methionine-sulfoxide reductase heme-binding subunit MsrQ [Candidatus Acidoferrales bacterium]|nr:protein-methionine-sulfoxide reductase heme-binding subunit MsrQ [Candidatus Acidoferrales bacterium]